MNLFQYTYDLVRQIPAQKVSSYGAVAEALGDIRASRAVGWMMNQNPDADEMPCYKIVYSDGRLGGFGLGAHDKIRRLAEDNIQVSQGKIVNFSTVFFNDFVTEYPLRKLQQEQQILARKVRTINDIGDITTVAGVDVAYRANAFDYACGAYVLMDYVTGDIIEKTTVFAHTFFPYIASYLAYREIPIIEKLMKQIRRKPSVLILDGNGILHPQGCGLASHVGVLYDIPSIGVAKTPFSKLVEEENKLFLSKKTKKPVYVSVGHRISIQKSREIIQNISRYKTPEPLRCAHMCAQASLSNQLKTVF